MKSIKTLTAVLLAWMAMTIGASAQQLAYTTRDAELHAGPAFEYPTVAIILSNIAITVEGCVDGYQWCDVVAGPYRGWMYGGDVVYAYQGGYYPVASYGSVIGLSIISFNTSVYWDRHYRTSPWYVQRQYWAERPVPSFRESREHREPPRGYAPPPRFEHDRPIYGREPEHRAVGGGGGMTGAQTNIRVVPQAPVPGSRPPQIPPGGGREGGNREGGNRDSGGGGGGAQRNFQVQPIPQAAAPAPVAPPQPAPQMQRQPAPPQGGGGNRNQQESRGFDNGGGGREGGGGRNR